MRFSEHGPNFPRELLDALLAGDVVFVCGAGVSAPQLPGFKGLVDRVFQDLNVEMEGGEQRAFNEQRYEEVLGSLARRLVHEGQMYRAVERILAPPQRPDLANHRTLLRLSRDLDNRVCLVTTNFDPLVEMAVARDVGTTAAQRISVAGQALPAPGSEGFEGVIHLHGRHADARTGLSGTPLVLTSAEYGDAYMRSGWAARFLFDLARCKTLVLVGYSAGDAPVRYLLNVLQADRERFTDLRPVYALDGVTNDEMEADERWSTIAVQPIPFRLANDGGPAFAPLWRDLKKLAALVEQPKKSRRARAAKILARTYASSSVDDRSDLAWLLKGRDDLWDVVLANVQDPEWFDHFSRDQLWQRSDSTRLLPFWFAAKWMDRRRLYAAARWCANGDRELSEGINNRLRLPREPLDPLWRKAWHILAQSNLERIRLRPDDAYQLAMELRQTPSLDADLIRAVDFLTPHLKIEPPWGGDEGEEHAPASLRDLYHVSETIGETMVGNEVSSALGALEDSTDRICELATAALGTTIRRCVDAELIVDGFDYLDFSVPSVEAHAQNEYHDGVVHLVVLLTQLLGRLVQNHRDLALRLTDEWKSLPGSVGKRMWLHSLRNRALFEFAAVFASVLALPQADFWAQRREIIQLLRERFGDATPHQVNQLVERIQREGPILYADLEPREGQTDWRPYARDHAMWVRLIALRLAGSLTEAGDQLLAAIQGRTPHLRRDLEEEDLFSSYSSGVHSIEGDPAPFMNAEPEERLDIAHRQLQSHDFDDRAGWLAYCRTDPSAAFATLSRVGFRTEDTELWRDLSSALAFPVPKEPDKLATRADLIRKTLRALDGQADRHLAPLSRSLTDLLSSRSEMSARMNIHWWDRLWRLARTADPPEDEVEGGRFYDRVINSQAGRLAEDLLKTIDQEKQRSGRASQANLWRLRRIAREPAFAGHLARGALARWVSYLCTIDEAFVERSLRPWLSGEDWRSKTLRAVICEWAQMGAASTRILKGEILRGVLESTASTNATHVAGKVLLPLLSKRLKEPGPEWGLTDADTARILKSCDDNIRVAAAQWLAIWQGSNELTPEERWARGIRTLFEAVWPKERKYKSQRITRELASCCTRTSSSFPEALEVFRPFFTTYTDTQGMPMLHGSDLPTRFPAQCLDFLWTLLRERTTSSGTYYLGESLDAIKAADPSLERDRRFQRLESITFRLA